MTQEQDNARAENAGQDEWVFAPTQCENTIHGMPCTRAATRITSVILSPANGVVAAALCTECNELYVKDCITRAQAMRETAEADLGYDSRCSFCGEKVFHTPDMQSRMKGHIYSESGIAEFYITRMCEWCFDEATKEPDICPNCDGIGAVGPDAVDGPPNADICEACGGSGTVTEESSDGETDSPEAAPVDETPGMDRAEDPAAAE